MSKRRFVPGTLLAIAAALPFAMPSSADARVFFGVGIGFPAFGFGGPFYAPYPYPPPYYYPPPVVYAPPPPPVVYAPPPASYGYGTTSPADGGPSAMARCVTGSIICPLRYVKPVGESCSCPDNAGRLVAGRVG